MYIKMLSLFLVFCFAREVFSKPYHQRSYEGYIAGCLEYDVCKIPTENKDEQDGGTAVSTIYNEDQLKEICTMTKDEIHAIKRLIRNIERKINCKRQVKHLNRKKLYDLVHLRTLGNEKKSITSITTSTYLEIAKVTHLFRYLNSTLFHSAKECCLPYPSGNIERLENRILMKWFFIQRGFGESIDVSNCNVNTQIKIEEPIECDNTRDIIYLLLKQTLKVLKQSTYNIPRTLHNCATVNDPTN